MNYCAGRIVLIRVRVSGTTALYGYGGGFDAAFMQSPRLEIIGFIQICLAGNKM